MPTQRVSVIIPAYNYGRFLRNTLRSVDGQDVVGCDIEILLVDDGSTDNTRDIVTQEFPHVHYILQKNQGEGVARNTGITAATGDFLLFLDADDLLPPDVIRLQLAALNAHADADITVCPSVQLRMQEGGSARMQMRPLFSAHLDVHLCAGNIAPSHSFLVRRTVAQKCAFDVDRRCAEDYWYWVRCAAEGFRMISSPSANVIYVKHPKSQQQTFRAQASSDPSVTYFLSQVLHDRVNFPECGQAYGHLALASAFLKQASLASEWERANCIQYAVRHLEAYAEGFRGDATAHTGYLEALRAYYGAGCGFYAVRLLTTAPEDMAQIWPRLRTCLGEVVGKTSENIQKERFRLLSALSWPEGPLVAKAQESLAWLERAKVF